MLPTTASGVLCFSEQDTLCGGHTWPWAVRYHAAFDAPANAPQEFWHRQPIDLDPDGVIFCGHTGWKAAVKLGLARVPPPRRAGPGGRDHAHSDAPTGENGTPPAEIGEGDELADPLPHRLDAVWPLPTDADRLAVVELAERLSVANWDGVRVDG